VAEHALAAGLDQAQAKRIELVLEEAVLNIFHHAYGGLGGKLELWCTPVPGGLEIRLIDDGPRFNPLEDSGREVATDIASQSIGGRGNLVIRGLTDVLRHQREGGRNVLTLLFLRNSGENS
jgi:anti-sigma regulatory factor (Ser/Thr protein kinase)